MNTTEKDILWKSYLSIRKYQHAGDALAVVLIITGISCAFMGRPDASITAAIIAVLAVFHSAHCRHTSAEIRAEIFKPVKRRPTRTPTLYIVNDFDRPEAKHLAARRKDGKFYYVHPFLRDKKEFHGMTPKRPVPLDDFGFAYKLEDGVITGHAVKASTATYEDGKLRQWQGGPAFEFKFKRKNQPIAKPSLDTTELAPTP